MREREHTGMKPDTRPPSLPATQPATHMRDMYTGLRPALRPDAAKQVREPVLTMHFARARLYPVTCRCVTSFHQFTKLDGGEGARQREADEPRARGS